MARIYVSADMEGTAGVCSWQQCDPENVHEYPVYRRAMTQEVRAAIEGAWEGGASDVLVNDSHWSMRNLLFDELPPHGNLRVVTGSPKPVSMGEGLDASFNAVFFTGYHGGAGDPGVLSHTFSPQTIYDVTMNGTRCSEMLLYAALAGSYGVPVTLVTGDASIVAEAARHLPWAAGVAVKSAIGYFAAESVSPEAARGLIRAGAREAIALIQSAQPFVFSPPVELGIATVGVEHADFMALLPGFERRGPRSVRFVGATYPQALAAFIVANRLGGAANAPA